MHSYSTRWAPYKRTFSFPDSVSKLTLFDPLTSLPALHILPRVGHLAITPTVELTVIYFLSILPSNKVPDGCGNIITDSVSKLTLFDPLTSLPALHILPRVGHLAITPTVELTVIYFLSILPSNKVPDGCGNIITTVTPKIHSCYLSPSASVAYLHGCMNIANNKIMSKSDMSLIFVNDTSIPTCPIWFLASLFFCLLICK